MRPRRAEPGPIPDRSGVADRYSAFSFVDRIRVLEPGVRARGRFHVPARITRFSAQLASEAVGQLAAWVAMNELGFRLRPVAGIASDVRYFADVPPGATIDLEVGIDRLDEESVIYHGAARVADAPAAVLTDILGPMLPAGDFDSPEDLRGRYQLLTTTGAAVDRLRELPALPWTVIRSEPGRSLAAQLDVPGFAPAFADHFPRKPVFPATLLVDRHVEMLRGLAAEVPGWSDSNTAEVRLTDLKQRAFVEPGSRLEMETKIERVGDEVLSARLLATCAGRRVAQARAEVRAGAMANV